MSSPKQLLDLAQKHLERGNTARALEALNAAAILGPGNPRIFLRKGDVHLRRGEHRDAIKAHLRSAAIYRDQGFARHALALLRNLLRAFPQELEVRLEMVGVLRTMAMGPEAATELRLCADTYLERHDPSNAMKMLEQAALILPNDVKLPLQAAQIAGRIGRLDLALKNYLAAMAIFEQQGDNDEVLRTAYRLRDVLGNEPPGSGYFALVTRAHLNSGDLPAAEAKIFDWGQISPSDPTLAQLQARLAQMKRPAPPRVAEQPERNTFKWSDLGRIFRGGAAAKNAPGIPAQASVPMPSSAPSPLDSDFASDAYADAAITGYEVEVANPDEFFGTSPDSEVLDDETIQMDMSGTIAALNYILVEKTPAPVIEPQPEVLTEVEQVARYNKACNDLLSEATEQLRSLLRLQPHNDDARERLSTVLLQLGRREDAFREMARLNDDPDQLTPTPIDFRGERTPSSPPS
ncbi:MAG: tetratricopeptide repeat protein [Deltaproteobacteria bacterium]|nr:tetratricopeptide repeat protein [Deltaproteobacteria bacterium]